MEGVLRRWQSLTLLIPTVKKKADRAGRLSQAGRREEKVYFFYKKAEKIYLKIEEIYKNIGADYFLIYFSY